MASHDSTPNELGINFPHKAIAFSMFGFAALSLAGAGVSIARAEAAKVQPVMQDDKHSGPQIGLRP